MSKSAKNLFNKARKAFDRANAGKNIVLISEREYAQQQRDKEKERKADQRKFRRHGG